MASNSTSTSSESKRIKELEAALAKSQADLTNTHADLANAKEELDSLEAESDGKFSIKADDNTMADILGNLDEIREIVRSWLGSINLSDVDRRRLLGSGVRRYGFIDKTSDLMTVNQEFVPSFLNTEAHKELIRMLEVSRNINVVLQQIMRANNDVLLILGDEAFRESMMFYGAVRDASLRRVQGAKELFNIMRQFFNRPRRTTDEPTEKVLLHDAKTLLQDPQEGKSIIKNEKPHLTGGMHEVTDESLKPKGAFKETVQAAICLQCGAQCENHAKFCMHCGQKL